MQELLPIITLAALVITLLVGIICLVKISNVSSMLKEMQEERSSSSSSKKRKKR